MSGYPRHLPHVRLFAIPEESTLLCKLPSVWTTSPEKGDRSQRRNFSPRMLLENRCLSSGEHWPVVEKGGWHRATVYGFLISFGEIPKGPLSKYLHPDTPCASGVEIVLFHENRNLGGLPGVQLN